MKNKECATLLSWKGVSNRWTGIWNGTMEWKMEWNNKLTKLQQTRVTGTRLCIDSIAAMLSMVCVP